MLSSPWSVGEGGENIGGLPSEETQLNEILPLS